MKKTIVLLICICIMISCGSMCFAQDNDENHVSTTLSREWTNIVQIVGNGSTIFGLKEDGTIVAAGSIQPEWNFSSWKGIKEIACTREELVGLKSDGTVLITPENADVKQWKGIKHIYSEQTSYIYGIKKDGGLVSSSGSNPMSSISKEYLDVGVVHATNDDDWEAIVNSNGMAVISHNGSNEIINNVKQVFSVNDLWDDILIVLHTDGTLSIITLYYPNEYYSKLNVEEYNDWEKIQKISVDNIWRNDIVPTTGLMIAAVDNKKNLILNSSAKEFYGDIQLSDVKDVYIRCQMLVVLLNDGTIKYYDPVSKIVGDLKEKIRTNQLSKDKSKLNDNYWAKDENYVYTVPMDCSDFDITINNYERNIEYHGLNVKTVIDAIAYGRFAEYSEHCDRIIEILTEDNNPIEKYDPMIGYVPVYSIKGQTDYVAIIPCLTGAKIVYYLGNTDDTNKTEEFKKAKVGDVVKFGSYDQDNNISNGKEDIEWLVLAKENNKILVISDKALDAKPYNTENKDVTWETCTLRKWLNSTFMTEAFSKEEQSIIQSSKVSADENPLFDTSPGKNTEDKVFLLSIDEAEKYFSSKEKRRCVPTEYAMAHGAYSSDEYNKDGEGTCWFWLRSTGCAQIVAAYVFENGSINYGGYYVSEGEYCVRPALWIKLDSSVS